jgi:uncharacterized membrane protein
VTDLIVLAFANEANATKMRGKLLELKEEGRLIELADAVFVVRKPAGKMTVKREVRLVGSNASQGLLLDFVFWMFYQEMAASAATNTSTNLQGYIGLDDKFVKEISRIMERCQGALFLLTAKFSENRVMDQLQDFNATILKKSLSKEDEATLMAVFGR